MRVYKYLELKWALKAIKEHRFKISEFADMNDPFELKGVALSEPRYHESFIRVANNMCALCLSKEWSNPLLWSHYAAKHKGLCLGFDIDPEVVEVLELSYVDSVAVFRVDVLNKLIATRRRPEAQPPDARNEAKELVSRLLGTKFKKWAYENEARVMVSKELKDGEHWFHPFDQEFKLCEVIAGVRCDEPRAHLEEAVKSYAEPPRIFKVRLADAAFEVVEDPNGFTL